MKTESQNIGYADNVKAEGAPATKTREGFEAWIKMFVARAMQGRTK